MKTILTPPAIIREVQTEEQAIQLLLDVIEKSSICINECKRKKLSHYRDIGESLFLLKEYTLRKRIDWIEWCLAKTGYDKDRAAKYIRVYTNWDLVKEASCLNKAMKDGRG